MKKQTVNFNIFYPEKDLIIKVINGATIQEQRLKIAGSEVDVKLREKPGEEEKP